MRGDLTESGSDVSAIRRVPTGVTISAAHRRGDCFGGRAVERDDDHHYRRVAADLGGVGRRGEGLTGCRRFHFRCPHEAIFERQAERVEEIARVALGVPDAFDDQRLLAVFFQ